MREARVWRTAVAVAQGLIRQLSSPPVFRHAEFKIKNRRRHAVNPSS
jgi:hypothetical protein